MRLKKLDGLLCGLGETAVFLFLPSDYDMLCSRFPALVGSNIVSHLWRF